MAVPDQFRRLLLLPLFSLAACGPSDWRADHAIGQAIHARLGGEIDMAEIVPTPWERLYVFPPYSDTSRIRRTLGFDWAGAHRSAISLSDGINLLIFTSGDRVVWATELTRDKGDFAEAYREQGYARDSARFQVIRDGALAGGAPHLKLLPAR